MSPQAEELVLPLTLAKWESWPLEALVQESWCYHGACHVECVSWVIDSLREETVNGYKEARNQKYLQGWGKLCLPWNKIEFPRSRSRAEGQGPANEMNDPSGLVQMHCWPMSVMDPPYKPLLWEMYGFLRKTLQAKLLRRHSKFFKKGDYTT